MTESEEHVRDFSSKLDMSRKTSAEAIRILRKAENKNLLSGKKKNGSAAAALYIAGILEDDRRTMQQIADAANVSESTITNRYKHLVQELGIKRR